MPWKETHDPYKIWVSEIILQQTRVSQGTGYYLRFIHKFPNIKSLAEAPQSEVLKAWEGLGYYSRARNLHAAAQDIQKRFKGKFPSSYEDIISLKGIGPYSAAAISSFAFDKPYAAVDGNVQRVLSRIFAIPEPIDTSQGKKTIQQTANSLLDRKEPGAFNQAIIDFGALLCTPKNSKCIECPVREDCRAHQENLVDYFPLKIKKIKVRNKYLYYFIIIVNSKIVIQKRGEKGIWAGLYEFPVIESYDTLSRKSVLSHMGWKKDVLIDQIFHVSHKLTHLNLNIKFFLVEGLSNIKHNENQRLEKVSELSTFAFPKPILSFLETSNLDNI